MPLVAGNTGIFMSMINNIASSIAVLVFKRVNLAYALAICVCSFAGAIPGILLQQRLVNWTGRPSSTVVLLLAFIVFSLVANPLISIDYMMKQSRDDVDIMTYG